MNALDKKNPAECHLKKTPRVDLHYLNSLPTHMTFPMIRIVSNSAFSKKIGE